jgi:hypothetical protein
MSESKQQFNVVIVEQKPNAIEYVDKGESVAKICSELTWEKAWLRLAEQSK